MVPKWKLLFDGNTLIIHNDGGKDLGYDPNTGIQILEIAGFAFKDINRNGVLDPFEDWRLPTRERVIDFAQRYQIVQTRDVLFYGKGILKLPPYLLQEFMENKRVQESLKLEDPMFLQENYLIILLLMMFDDVADATMCDYILELFIEGTRTGLLNNVFYTIRKAVENYLHGSRKQLQLRL